MITRKQALLFAAASILPATSLAAGTTTNQIFVSSDALDKRVIYQDFAFYLPYDSTLYTKLAEQAPTLKLLGITDVWFAPPYRAFAESPFEEGYATADRYDLGEFPQGHGGALATKYGTATQLHAAIDALHKQKISALADITPNQLFGLGGREVTPVTAVDIFGNPNNPNIVGALYPGYTAGGGQGQQTYGQIKQWSSAYENGTSTQALGLDRILVDGSFTPYRYYGPNDGRNYLPSFLAGTEAAQVGALNTVGTYLSVDGYYAVQDASTLAPIYRPYLIYYVDPQPGATITGYLSFMRTQGFAGATDDEVRQSIIAGDTTLVANATNAYLGSQPGYSSIGEANIAALRFDGSHDADIGENVLQYEFLVGTDVDNSNPAVQAEVVNWQKFLLDEYHFDGFRFDATGHYNTDILRQSAALLSGRYQKNINNHLSVIESYVDQSVPFENSNNNGQLAYDADLYNSLSSNLEQANPNGPLSTIITGSIAAEYRTGSGAPIPNWSFVSNHDQEHNVIANIPVPSSNPVSASPGSPPYQLAEMAIYDADRQLAVKQYSPYNVPAAYALILTNKNTVPTIFYGDVFDSDQGYAAVTTPYAQTIIRLLAVRKLFVSGAQKTTLFTSNTSSVAGQDLLASVRYGTGRFSGVATVIGNNPSLNTTIKVDMGPTHANQWFVNAVSDQPEIAATDFAGRLSVSVAGKLTPQVRGYLGVWIPVPL